MSVTAAEHMVAAFNRLFAENRSPAASLPVEGGVRLSTGEMDPFGNFAVGMPEDALLAALEDLARNPVPSFTIRPGERDPRFEAKIAPIGYAHGATLPGMTVDLATVPNPDLPEGAVFERVTRDHDFQAWADSLASGYPVAPMAAQAMSPVHIPLNEAEDADIQFFQVRIGQEIAGVSALVLTEGLAGIYCVATLPEHRRKGIGAALTAKPLLVARDLGYKTGVLQASHDGYPVYRKLGFVDESEVQLYIHMPEGGSESAGAH